MDYWNIMIGIFVLYILVCIIVVLFGMIRKSPLNKDRDKDYIHINGRVKVWLLGCLFWTSMGYFLAAVSLTSSFFAILCDADEKIYTIIAAGTAIFSFIIVPQKHSRAYRMAYTLLDHAVNLYSIKKITGKKLIETVGICERVIDQSYDVSSDKDYLNCYDSLLKCEADKER